MQGNGASSVSFSKSTLIPMVQKPINSAAFAILFKEDPSLVVSEIKRNFSNEILLP